MPNNGRKIYTETRNGVKYGVDLEADVYKVLGVSPSQTLGAFCDRVCCNEHGKINKFAKHKPYAFGPFEELTDNLRKAYNHGMSPTLLKINYIEELCSTPPWGQWSPPSPGEHWCRVTDFEDYDHLAEKFIRSVELRTSAGANYTVPICHNPSHPQGSASLYGRVQFDNTADLRLSDFTANTVNGATLGDLYLTLGIAHEVFDTIYVAQADVPISEQMPEAVVEMVTTDIYNIDGVPNLSDLGPNNKVFLGLYPKIEVGPGYVSKDFGSADLSTLYSLDMWGDGFRQVVYNRQAPVKFGTGGAGGTAPEKETVVVRATASRKQFDIAEYSYSEYGSSLSLRPQVNLGSDYIAWDPSSSDKLSMLFGAGWYLKFNARLELFENGMTAYDGTIDVLPRDYGGTSGASFDLVQWAYGNPVYFEFNEPVRFDGVYIGSGVRYTGRLTLTLDAYCSTKIPLIRDASTGEDIRLVCEFEIS